MNNNQPAETYVSVMMSRDGGVIIYQGYYHQALFLAREDVAQFIEDPRQTKLRVIPPLAALGLHCYTSLEEIQMIHVSELRSEWDHYVLTITTTSGKALRYVSQHKFLQPLRKLVQERIAIVVTPKMTALVHATSKPALAPVVQMPDEEIADYKRRFAHDPRLLADAVSRTLSERAPALRYAN